MSLNDVNASLLKDIDPIGSANRLCAVSFQDDIAQLRFGNSCLLVDPTNSQLIFYLLKQNLKLYSLIGCAKYDRLNGFIIYNAWPNISFLLGRPIASVL